MEDVAVCQDRLRSPLSADCYAIAYRAMDELEQALYARCTIQRGGLIHHSDRGSQYVSIRYTERLGKAGIEPSVGSVGDAYDRASGRHLFKTTGEGLGQNHKWPLQNRGLI